MRLLKLAITTLLLSGFTAAFGQHNLQPEMQNFRKPGFEGVNVFEAPKADTVNFDGLKVRLGGDFAMQFQGLSHSNSGTDTLINLGSNFNLPTANLNVDVQMADGIRLHLRTYLSSRHHPEAWVKGGHLNIEKLDFIKEGFLSGVMDKVTIRVGLDEINYGDAHFRRSDNAGAIYNPFVGNYIIDGFTTEAFGEFYFRSNGFLAMAAVSNGKLNQSVDNGTEDVENTPSFYGKLGYDKQIDPDLRLRLTGSAYYNNGDQSIFLYNGDRASSRYYNVMDNINGDGTDWSGRLTFTVPELTSFQINPFVKYKGLEFFGIYEMIAAKTFGDEDLTYTQLGAEALYRFGEHDQLYIGGRYNTVTGDDTAEGRDITRFNVGGGWFITDNIMAKVEYMQQTYDGDGWAGRFDEGEFNGVVVEAVVSF
ncbi:MAG: hypothetical protein LC664_14725 [Flavobacteriales bacterium]|nr:hypothetical protein [Flavobacteriales bacterium]